jgi:hypothetical protein
MTSSERRVALLTFALPTAPLNVVVPVVAMASEQGDPLDLTSFEKVMPPPPLLWRSVSFPSTTSSA